MEQQADNALKAKNPFDALRLAMTANKKTPYEIVSDTVGSVLYLYYLYIDGFQGVRPLDMDDLIDGLLYLDVRQRIRDE